MHLFMVANIRNRRRIQHQQQHISVNYAATVGSGAVFGEAMSVCRHVIDLFDNESSFGGGLNVQS